MKQIILVVLTCLIGQLFNCSIFAQEEEIELGEIVVTATKTEKEIKDIPASVSIIKKEELEMAPSQNNIADFIKQTPSVDARNLGGMANTVPLTVSLRGMGLRGTLLLVDNQVLNDGLNGFANFHLIPKEDIEKIEIIRGPFSALYGSNAIGGVINVITKHKVKEKIKGYLEFGNFGYQNYRVTKSGILKNMDYSLTLERRYMDNYLADKSKINRDYEDNRVKLKISKDIDEDSRLTFISGYFRSKAGYGLAENISPKRESEIKKEDYQGNLIYEKRMGKLDYKINLSTYIPDNEVIGESIDPEQTQMFPPPPNIVYVPSINNYSSFDTVLHLEGNLKLERLHSLTFGLENVWNKGKWSIKNSSTAENLSDKIDKEIRNFAFYVQDEVKLNEELLLILGSRVDSHSQFGSEVSPKASLNYKLNEDTNIYTSFGHAFREPTLGELYSPAWMRIPGKLYIGNPDLKPEKCDSYEVGLKYKIKEGLNTNISFYQNKAKDLLVLQSSGNFEKSENIGKAKTEGIECEILWRMNKSLHTFLNYSYLDTEDEETGESLDYSPHNKANLGLRGNLKNVNFNLSTNFVDKRFYTDRQTSQRIELKSYAITDLNINYLINGKFTLVATGKNIFNKTYEEYGGYNAPKRTVSLGIRKDF